MVDWFPQEKGCIFSGKNFVKIQMASQDWCLEDGSLKFSCRKNTSKVSCYFRECTSCLSFNPIFSLFFSPKDGPEEP